MIDIEGSDFQKLYSTFIASMSVVREIGAESRSALTMPTDSELINFHRGNALDQVALNLGSAFFETTWLHWQYLGILQATVSVFLSLEFWCTRSWFFLF